MGVISYLSKSLNKSRTKLLRHKKEAAVAKLVEHYHSFLYGRQFIIRTDKAAQQWLHNFSCLVGETSNLGV